jgi:hypothetical protein
LSDRLPSAAALAAETIDSAAAEDQDRAEWLAVWQRWIEQAPLAEVAVPRKLRRIPWPIRVRRRGP